MPRMHACRSFLPATRASRPSANGGRELHDPRILGSATSPCGTANRCRMHAHRSSIPSPRTTATHPHEPATSERITRTHDARASRSRPHAVGSRLHAEGRAHPARVHRDHVRISCRRVLHAEETADAVHVRITRSSRPAASHGCASSMLLMKRVSGVRRSDRRGHRFFTAQGKHHTGA